MELFRCVFLAVVCDRLFLGRNLGKIGKLAVVSYERVIIEAFERVCAIVHHARAADFAARFLERGVFGVLFASAYKPRLKRLVPVLYI